MLAGDILFYRDFVSQYNCDGRKVSNFVLVARWRKEDDGPLHTFKFNNFCSDKGEFSADAFLRSRRLRISDGPSKRLEPKSKVAPRGCLFRVTTERTSPTFKHCTTKRPKQ